MHWLWLCLKCECAQGLSNTNVGIQQSYWERFPEGTVTQLGVSAWPLGCACSTHLQLCHQQAPAKSTQLLKESSLLWSWVNFAGNSKHILLSKFILLPINRGRLFSFGSRILEGCVTSYQRPQQKSLELQLKKSQSSPLSRPIGAKRPD